MRNGGICKWGFLVVAVLGWRSYNVGFALSRNRKGFISV